MTLFDTIFTAALLYTGSEQLTVVDPIHNEIHHVMRWERATDCFTSSHLRVSRFYASGRCVWDETSWMRSNFSPLEGVSERTMHYEGVVR